jgi:hypothetical protein
MQITKAFKLLFFTNATQRRQYEEADNVYSLFFPLYDYKGGGFKSVIEPGLLQIFSNSLVHMIKSRWRN